MSNYTNRKGAVPCAPANKIYVVFEIQLGLNIDHIVLYCWYKLINIMHMH